MAVSPNSTCESFCIWLQATAWLKITTPQDVIIEEVKDAAASSGSVTEHVWNEFLRTTGLWYQYYVAYIAQTTSYAILPSGIVQGDLLFGSAANTLSRLAKSAGTSNFLKNSGASNNPAWSQPAFADLSDYTAWTDYSGTSTIVGWSSTTIKLIRYLKWGKTVFVEFYITGTSNATTTSFTLPVTFKNITNYLNFGSVGYAQNNGVTNFYLGGVNPNTSKIDFYYGSGAAAWTNSGTKSISGYAQWEIE